MPTPELTEEDVFNNDIDPLDAIRALRREEGVAEEDLIEDHDTPDKIVPETTAATEEDDLSAFDGDEDPDKDPADDVKETTEDVPEDDATAELEDNQEGDKPEEGQAPGVRTFKANGQEFKFTEEEISQQFETVFGKAMDYTQKMQKIAPYRKMISAIEEEGITQEQLDLAIDALKGNKGALTEIMKVHEIDSFDLGDAEETPYSPNSYGKDQTTTELQEVASRLSQDTEVYSTTVDVVDRQWDSASRDVFRQNPRMIEGLHNDIKNGIYTEVASEAAKMKVLDGNTKSDLEYYMLAGQQLQTKQQALQNGQQAVNDLNGQTQSKVSQADAASSDAQRRRAASSTRARADRKGVIDYLDDDDEAFDDWYNKTMSSV